MKKNTFRIKYHTASGRKVEFTGEAESGAQLVAEIKAVVETLETGIAKEAEAEAAFRPKG